jgi:hypothetical protein
MTDYITRDVPRLSLTDAELAARIAARNRKIAGHPDDPPPAGRRLTVCAGRHHAELRLRGRWFAELFPAGSIVRVSRTPEGAIMLTKESQP